MQGQITQIGLLGPETDKILQIQNEIMKYEGYQPVTKILREETAYKIKQNGGIIIFIVNSVKVKENFKPTMIMEDLIDHYIQVLEYSNWRQALKDIIEAHDNMR